MSMNFNRAVLLKIFQKLFTNSKKTKKKMFSSKRKRYQTYHYIKQSVGSTLEYRRISIMLAACYLSSLRSFLISDNITESILIEPFSQSMVLFCRVKRQFNIVSNTDKSISYKKINIAYHRDVVMNPCKVLKFTEANLERPR